MAGAGVASILCGEVANSDLGLILSSPADLLSKCFCHFLAPGHCELLVCEGRIANDDSELLLNATPRLPSGAGSSELLESSRNRAAATQHSQYSSSSEIQKLGE